jgi:hypothetical protein
MAEPHNDQQDNRTDLQKEIDRQQIYDEAAKAWAAQQKALADYWFDHAVGGNAPVIPYVPEAQRAHESMQRLFEMRQQQQHLEKDNQGGQSSPMRLPKLEWNPRFGNTVPLPTQAAPAASAPRLAAPPSPQPESGAPHWLASLASTPLSPAASDAPPWRDPGPVGKGLRRLLGFPE